ncbi:hypothetical protein SAMN05443377_10357 [Propionibacterium cyclohexanicum]|uniref:phosphomannomutase n=1 Tax=Propionibacterium cyclohexanicum TaxID=64702 RepID=A0A1H9QEM0_9ACTN|nr:HAD-IIB family hydrolase [Propionibacterium cyclohexanicum]SER58625.1 hypothetical protein SAMN05443377_10357 [Propionibacterium cyclohexanicum]
MENSCRDRFPALIAFDLDDTLAPSKSPLPPAMSRTLTDLLTLRPVCVISGGQFGQFREQLLDRLPAEADLTQLHLMPTCGTRYLRHIDGAWRELYARDLTVDERERAITALTRHAKALHLWEPDALVRGDRIEDRGSQVTYSALGQHADVASKRNWDPAGEKREALRSAVAAELPGLEVRAGGSTSIDITRRGIDKGYGMAQLAEQTGIGLDEMLFVGDRLEPGGNDYPVRALGVPCHAVSGPRETLEFLAGVITELRAGGRPACDLLSA